MDFLLSLSVSSEENTSKYKYKGKETVIVHSAMSMSDLSSDSLTRSVA